MKKEFKNIEELFQKSFEVYKIEPSKGVWSKIKLKLDIRDFFSADFSSFNIYYLSAVAGLIALSVMLLPGREQNKVMQQITQKTEITEVKENPKQIIHEIKPKITSKKVAVSHPAEVYTHTELITASESGNTELLPLPLKNNLKEFAKIYGDTLQKIGTIKVSPPVPKFSLELKTGCLPFEITLKNQTKNAQFFEWNFGDGNTSTLPNPVHTFQNPGKYSIRLKAIGIGGIAYCIMDSVVVYDVPKVKVNWPNDEYLFENEKFTIVCESSNAIKYEWNFGDGTISTQKRLDYAYKTKGNYSIFLKTWTENNCMDSIMVKDVEVKNIEKVIQFPNAFFPNPNGPSSGNYSEREIHNDIFHPVVKEEIIEYKLKIYSKEGGLVFESDDVHIGWDGYYQKQRMPEGVYPYIVTGKFDGGKSFLKKGNVTIIYRK